MSAQPLLLVAAGGTGGHIFPGIAIAHAMIARGWRVEWLGTHGGMERDLVPKAGLTLHSINFEGFVGKSLLRKGAVLFRLLTAMMAARTLLKRLKPNVILGMGGFPALPAGLVARGAAVPLLIHEQNAVPGRTNKLLASRADKVLAAFPNTFPAATGATVVGNPVRKDILEVARVRDAWDGNRPLRIAIVGGSRGAQALNEIIPHALAQFCSIPAAQKQGNSSEIISERERVTQRVAIVHQCGKGNADAVVALYASLGVDARVVEFVDDMAALYRDTDLIICRSGASTVSEIACAELSAVFVPYPHHADQQQLFNAKVLSEHDAAFLIEQKMLSADRLSALLRDITPARLATMRERLAGLAQRNATDRIADELEHVRSFA